MNQNPDANLTPDKTPPQGSHPQPGNPQPAMPVYIPRKDTKEYQAARKTAQSSKGIAAALFAAGFSVLFIETVFLGEPAVSVFLLTLLYSGFILWYFHDKGKTLNRQGVLLTLPITVISLSFALFYNPSGLFLRAVTLLCLLCIQLVLLSDTGAGNPFTFDMLVRAASAAISRPLSNLDLGFISLGTIKKSRGKKTAIAFKAAGGLLLSLPVALLLLTLFMQADAIFESRVQQLLAATNISFGRVFGDLFLGFLMAVYAAAVLIYAKSEGNNIPRREGKRFLDPIGAATFLGTVNVVMLLFVGFQFTYLFFGGANSLPDGLTYAEYARRGFFELAAASALCFGIAVLVMAFCRQRDGALPLGVRMMLLIMCGGNGMVLASAVKRMLLYVGVYGLSIRRALTLWLMAVIAVSLIWMLLRCLFARLPVQRLIGSTVIAGVCLLSLCNLDRTVARYNVERYLADPLQSEIDVSYFHELSYAALPELAYLKEQLSADGVLSAEPTDDDKTAAQKAAWEGELLFTVTTVMEHMQYRLDSRHFFYGYTFDTPALRAVSGV